VAAAVPGQISLACGGGRRADRPRHTDPRNLRAAAARPDPGGLVATGSLACPQALSRGDPGCLSGRAALADPQFQISQGRLGWNLWVGTWERNADWQLPAPPAFPAYAFRSAREEQAIRKAMASNDEPLLRRIAVDRISTDPLGTIAIWLGRYPQLWLGTRSELTELRPARGTAAWSAIKAGLYGLNALLLAAALAGAALALRRRSGLLFFLLPVAYTAAIYLPFHNAETRYSLLALPFLFIFSSLFLVELMRHMRRRPRPAEA
jgi:hypothetical protein